MKQFLLTSLFLAILSLGGCGSAEDRSTLSSFDQENEPVAQVEQVEVVHYSYPLDHTTISRFRAAGETVARYIPYSGRVANWITDRTNTNLNHEDVMIIKRFSNGKRVYQSAAWGKVFYDRGEVEYFKEFENTSHLIFKESIFFEPQAFSELKINLHSIQSSYAREDYRLRGDWLSSGWNCQTMADEVWAFFKYNLPPTNVDVEGVLLTGSAD